MRGKAEHTGRSLWRRKHIYNSEHYPARGSRYEKGSCRLAVAFGGNRIGSGHSSVFYLLFLPSSTPRAN
ncbi:hypothetical protein VFPPC_16608 [Pochonia chlamydosporia 170]|uniref:Uncharacterized protein n=1 Tax=Pochonia chlamydosporia 170 TaxID=1380566 RepID=A0A179F9M7_METCM|nr:hypothetical protein VFPPC_16608 [Pochonia chlamydosporia 170]OAQ62107.1 hypothetical protein VFPPC_16608 [Pochonia chlamydosporia 170]